MKGKTNPKQPGSPQAQVKETKRGPTRNGQPQAGKWLACKGRMTCQVLSHGDLNRRTKEEVIRRQLKPRRDLEVEKGLKGPCEAGDVRDQNL